MDVIKVSLRTFGLLLVVGVIVEAVVVVLLLRASEPRPRNPIGIPTPPVAAPVYFAPIGDVPSEETDGLARHYQGKFGLRITVLPELPVPVDAFDADRGQLIGERLLDALASTEAARQDPHATVIGLTSLDIYTLGEDWNYAYSLRRDRFAVVSTARMGDGWFTDPTRRMQRIRKMVTKNLGVLYYRLPLSDDPGSVLYRSILGPQDLDRASEDF